MTSVFNAVTINSVGELTAMIIKEFFIQHIKYENGSWSIIIVTEGQNKRGSVFPPHLLYIARLKHSLLRCHTFSNLSEPHKENGTIQVIELGVNILFTEEKMKTQD